MPKTVTITFTPDELAPIVAATERLNNDLNNHPALRLLTLLSGAHEGLTSALSKLRNAERAFKA